ncbi:ThuA domain-containing protein [Fictibacillus phosphorivorans]|uniref:ThuA domain-containing protein n=1 Tax=Fictibacillus phosphorivorans TaxID=1221500 RepID=UPI00203A8B75|nr:ThuA domain-containing protein [Fictibacillus phosphorivorans]MCM3717786.1 ThuA domain-containing protein [Fictibacillus phosphorivorans]MCM3777014.1 ThuA domain-containing protein [Fictibacillus phosphorivorans]
MKKALIVSGGWSGHKPKEISEILAAFLKKNDFEAEISNTLDIFLDEEKINQVDLIVPNWTMGDLTDGQLQPLLQAVRNGVGLAGIHGGMGDAFRNATDYQFMVGGQFVAHPGGDNVEYTVHMGHPHPATEGIHDFTVTSELYYMHVDPVIEIIAYTTIEDIRMPVAWTKMFGKGRIFYCALGHSIDLVEREEVTKMVTQGMVWAAK